MYSRNNDTETYWRVLGEYAKLRRQHCDSFYSVLNDNYSSDTIQAVADLIHKLGATVESFLAAQFQGADAYSYPTLQSLARYPAAERWKLYMFNKSVDLHVRVQEIYLMNAMALWDLPIQDLVLLPFIPFTAWFRVLNQMDREPPEELVAEALEELSNPALVTAIKNAGLDPTYITKWRKE